MMPHLCAILSWDPTKRMRAAQTLYCCPATDPDTSQQRDESFCKIPLLIPFTAMEIFCQAGRNERWKGPSGTWNADDSSSSNENMKLLLQTCPIVLRVYLF